MDDNFDIPVTYKSQQLSFPATLIATGYTYKIQVNVHGKLISFEPDEERNFRAIANTADFQQNEKIDANLLEEIAASLERICR